MFTSIIQTLHLDSRSYIYAVIAIITIILAVSLARFLFRLRVMSDVLLGSVQKQGSWGEKTLYNILNHAGLKHNIDYLQQPAYEKEENKASIRPDCVLNMPGHQKLVIDAKVCLLYSSRKNSQKHSQSIKKQLKILRDKNYSQHIPGCVSTMIMFLPTDAMLSDALSVDHQIINKAIADDIIIATPTTIMLSISIIEKFYCQKELKEHYLRASRAYKELVCDTNSLVSSLQKIERESSLVRSIHSKITTLLETVKNV